MSELARRMVGESRLSPGMKALVRKRAREIHGQFKVGDRVKCVVGEPGDSFVGRAGTYLVRWDKGGWDNLYYMERELEHE